jgi:hypothetical protein
VRDILVPELLPDNRSIATRAVSGVDGQMLWSRPCGVNPNVQPHMEDWVPPAAVDLDGDGQTEFVLLDVQSVDDAGQPIRPVYRTLALEGKDGKLRWSARRDMHESYWHPIAGQRKSDLLRPRVLRTGAKQQVAVSFPPGSVPGKVAVLAADGRQLSTNTSLPGIWPCDIDRDGTDEVAFLSSESLCVARADSLQAPVWTRRIGTVGQQRILQILATEASAPPVIVVAGDATDNTVRGINAADGKTVWSCPGLIPRDPRDGVYLTPTHVALLDEGKAEPPRVYYAYGSIARCRQAASTSTRIAPPTRGAASDDRWNRDLPWVNPFVNIAQQTRFIGWSLVYSAFLIVLPASYLSYLVWSRRFTLSTLLLLPVIAGLFLTVALMRPPMRDGDFFHLGARMSIGVFVSPAIIAPALLAWWLLRGRWRPVVIWLGIGLLLTLVGGMIAFDLSSRRTPLLPEESYDWTHWYILVMDGAFVTAWLLVLVTPLHYAVLALWRRWKTPKYQPAA